VSTARDYLRFLLMVEGGGELGRKRILSAGSVRLMTTNQLPKEAFPIYFGKEIRHATGFGLGFSVRTADSAWDPTARAGEYGWGGAASTHYWVSPGDRIVVVTMEQTMPYSFDTEFAVKGPIYDALLKP
jgi:CubicO group peptidase (beta-lactamase class C family)